MIGITSGFAKRKKYVGGIYSCDGSDIPATDDRGTVQYQGPSDTILTIPDTTVTYTIVGKANCGNRTKDIRRITTRTYSLANQEINYATGTSPYFASFDSVPNSIWITNYNSNTVSKVNITTGTKTDYATGSGPRGVAFDNVTNSIWVANFSSNTVSKININDGTWHYLYVQEVWTFDLI